MTASAFVDTNVAVYVHDDTEKDKQLLAAEVFLNGDGHRLVVSTQVLIEFYVTVTRKLAKPLGAAAARGALAELALLPVVGADAAFVTNAVHLAERHQLSPWDGMIIQAAVVAGCETLLTEDLTDGATIEGVRIVNPFE